MKPKIIFSTNILYFVTYSKAETNILYIPSAFYQMNKMCFAHQNILCRLVWGRNDIFIIIIIP